MTLKIEGFEQMDARPRPRLILAVDARQKRGKSRFAMTAPRPIAYINLDRAYESSADFDTTDIYISDISGAAQKVKPGKGKLGEDSLKEPKKVAEEVLDLIIKRFTAAVDAGVRTVVLDTATRWWEIMRIARFGKIQQVSKEHYGPVKAEFERYLFQAMSCTSNIILLHRQRDEYQGDNKTGRFERAGYNDIQYIVHASVELTRIPFEQREEGDLGFRARISDCGTAPEADGIILANENITFLDVAIQVRPDSTPDMWM
jgi:AAA domain-containing protein